MKTNGIFFIMALCISCIALPSCSLGEALLNGGLEMLSNPSQSPEKQKKKQEKQEKKRQEKERKREQKRLQNEQKGHEEDDNISPHNNE